MRRFRESFKTKLIAVYLMLTSPLALCASSPSSATGRPEILRLNEGKELQSGSIFVYGDPTLDDLIAVKVLGAVGKAGVHYVPRGTDLITLISLAGGTASDAEIQDATVKRVSNGKETMIPVNLEKMVLGTSIESLTVQSNDTIYVPHTRIIISDNLSRLVTVGVGLATIMASLVVVSRARN